jgi:hypothetical protein
VLCSVDPRSYGGALHRDQGSSILHALLPQIHFASLVCMSDWRRCLLLQYHRAIHSGFASPAAFPVGVSLRDHLVSIATGRRVGFVFSSAQSLVQRTSPYSLKSLIGFPHQPRAKPAGCSSSPFGYLHKYRAWLRRCKKGSRAWLWRNAKIGRSWRA